MSSLPDAPQNGNRRWTYADDRLLAELLLERSMDTETVARVLGRSENSIRNRTSGVGLRRPARRAAQAVTVGPAGDNRVPLPDLLFDEAVAGFAAVSRCFEGDRVLTPPIFDAIRQHHRRTLELIVEGLG